MEPSIAEGNIGSDVLSFISRFTKTNQEQIEQVFTCGCCYWFSKILEIRFANTIGTTIMYDPIMNHFGTRIGTNIYDITGDVSTEYTWTQWDDFDDELERGRIIKNCIMF